MATTLNADGEETLPIVNAVRSARTVLEEDVWIYRIVVIALGIAVLGALGGAIAIELVTRAKDTIPDILVALGSGAVGALAGLITPPGRR